MSVLNWLLDAVVIRLRLLMALMLCSRGTRLISRWLVCRVVRALLLAREADTVMWARY